MIYRLWLSLCFVTVTYDVIDWRLLLSPGRNSGKDLVGFICYSTGIQYCKQSRNFVVLLTSQDITKQDQVNKCYLKEGSPDQRLNTISRLCTIKY